MSKIVTVITTIVLILFIVGGIYFSATPTGRGKWNTYFHKVRQVDDGTNYATRKKVEDTCRAMISSYNSDKLTYEQYKDSESEEKQSWAEQAKMRANKTASTYNNYILKNNYVWQNDVPSDIYTVLDYI